MNTHIHLLESFTRAYTSVWPDPTLRARLEEMLAIVRDKICVEPGVMNLYFTHAWQPIPDHDSYGHDVETAYLMLETDEVLHRTQAHRQSAWRGCSSITRSPTDGTKRTAAFSAKAPPSAKPEDTAKSGGSRWRH